MQAGERTAPTTARPTRRAMTTPSPQPSADGNDMAPDDRPAPDGAASIGIERDPDDAVVEIEAADEGLLEPADIDGVAEVAEVADAAADDPAFVPEEIAVDGDAEQGEAVGRGAPDPVAEPEAPRKRRSGWWQRGIFGS